MSAAICGDSPDVASLIRATDVEPASSGELHDVKAAVVIRAVDQACGIDEDIGALDHLGAVGPAIHHARGPRRHQRSDFLRPVLVANIEYAKASILIGGENAIRAHEAPR